MNLSVSYGSTFRVFPGIMKTPKKKKISKHNIGLSYFKNQLLRIECPK